MRVALPLALTYFALLACSKSPEAKTDDKAGANKSAANKSADDAAPPTGEGLPPNTLAAKIESTPCGLVSAADVQAALGLDAAPTTESGTADKPTRAWCRYGWTEGEQARYIEVAWATALQDQPEKIAKGRALAEQDVDERRLQAVDLPGPAAVTWGEHWLTVYANDRQMLWVITEHSGKTLRDGRDAATKIAAAIVQ